MADLHSTNQYRGALIVSRHLDLDSGLNHGGGTTLIRKYNRNRIPVLKGRAVDGFRKSQKAPFNENIELENTLPIIGKNAFKNNHGESL